MSSRIDSARLPLWIVAVTLLIAIATVPACSTEAPDLGDRSGETDSTEATQTQGTAPGSAPATGTAGTGSTARPSGSSSAGTTTAPRSAARQTTGGTTSSGSAPVQASVTVPAGALLQIEFLDSLSSATSQAGDPFRARVLSDHYEGGVIAIPAGSVVGGTVVEAVPLTKKIGGKARLALEFSSLQLPSGQLVGINAMFAEQGKSETAKDAATIGGAAAGGALLGRVLKKDDRKKGTVIGAIVGAAAGTAIAAKTEGQEVEVAEGAIVDIELADPVTIRRRG